MKYGIKTDGNIIAKFEHSSDRDICIKALKEVYTDCKFEAADNLEETIKETEETVEETEETVEETEEVKYPICPLNMYFEGDEGKCDTSKCDFDTERRECSTGCEAKKEQ